MNCCDAAPRLPRIDWFYEPWGKEMIHMFSRSLFVVVLLSTWIFGGFAVTRPMHGAAKSTDFSAASQVLSQTGIVGKWSINESDPVQCTYPSSTSSVGTMNIGKVQVFPAAGLSAQYAEVTVLLKRRLPDGSLQTAHSWKGISGTPTTQAPLDTSNLSGSILILDLGSTYVETISIDWFFGPTVSGHVEL